MAEPADNQPPDPLRNLPNGMKDSVNERIAKAGGMGAFQRGVPVAMDAAGLAALIEAIRHLHGLEATWLESVPVVEAHEGATVWAGEVQVFAVETPKG